MKPLVVITFVVALAVSPPAGASLVQIEPGVRDRVMPPP